MLNDKKLKTLSEGENYPVEDDAEISIVDDAIVDDAIIDDAIIDAAVVDSVILYPGSGYSPGDSAVDDNGVEYELKIDDGKIVEALPVNRVKVNNLPNITIITETGTGALIKPIIKSFIPEQREVVDVIDCIDTQKNIKHYQ